MRWGMGAVDSIGLKKYVMKHCHHYSIRQNGDTSPKSPPHSPYSSPCHDFLQLLIFILCPILSFAERLKVRIMRYVAFDIDLICLLITTLHHVLFLYVYSTDPIYVISTETNENSTRAHIWCTTPNHFSLSLWHLPLRPIFYTPLVISRIGFWTTGVYHHQLCGQPLQERFGSQRFGMGYQHGGAGGGISTSHRGSCSILPMETFYKTRPDHIISYSFSCSNSFEGPLLPRE